MIPNGYKQTEIGVIPLDWEVVKLGDVATFSKGKGIFKKDISETGIECIRYGELFTTYKEIIKTIKSKTNSIHNMVYSKLNDTLMPTSDVTPRGLAIASALDKENIILGGDILIIRSEKILNSYLSYFIRSNKKEIMKLVSGSTVYHIYAKDMQKLKIPLPPLTQQKKIAKILSTTDNKIEAITKQIEKAEMVKKGLMQRLLSEGLGHSEFKDSELGKIPESWEVEKIGSICDCIVPGRNKPIDFDGNIPWITTPDLDNKYISNTKNNLYISKIEAKKIGSKIVPVNSIIMSCVGNLGILAISKNEMVINQQLHAFLPSELANMEYLHYALFRQKKYMNKIATKTAVPYMNKDNCNSILVPLPPLKEQTQIANILTKSDQKIEILKSKKEQYQTLKTGLMQKLLTGEIRV